MEKERFRDIGSWELRYIAYELDEQPESYYFGRRVTWGSTLGVIHIERYCERSENGAFYYPEEVPPDKGEWVVHLPGETQYFDTEPAAWDFAEEFMEETG